MRSTRAVVLAAAIVAVVSGVQGLATADDEPVVTEPPPAEPTVSEVPPPEPPVAQPPATEPAPEPAVTHPPPPAPPVTEPPPAVEPAPSTSAPARVVAPEVVTPRTNPDLPEAKAQVFFSSCEEAARAGYWN